MDGGAIRSNPRQQSAGNPYEHGRDDEAQHEQHAEQHGFFAFGADRAEQAEQRR